MEIEKKYTSLDLSEKLAGGGCNLISRFWWVASYFNETKNNIPRLTRYNLSEFRPAFPPFPYFAAYDILNDICCRFAREFFGDGYVCHSCGKFKCDCLHDMTRLKRDNITLQIFWLMRQGKKQEAEDYIWANTVFNPANGKGD